MTCACSLAAILGQRHCRPRESARAEGRPRTRQAATRSRRRCSRPRRALGRVRGGMLGRTRDVLPDAPRGAGGADERVRQGCDCARRHGDRGARAGGGEEDARRAARCRCAHAPAGRRGRERVRRRAGRADPPDGRLRVRSRPLRSRAAARPRRCVGHGPRATAADGACVGTQQRRLHRDPARRRRGPGGGTIARGAQWRPVRAWRTPSERRARPRRRQPRAERGVPRRPRRMRALAPRRARAARWRGGTADRRPALARGLRLGPDQLGSRADSARCEGQSEGRKRQASRRRLGVRPRICVPPDGRRRGRSGGGASTDGGGRHLAPAQACCDEH